MTSPAADPIPAAQKPLRVAIVGAGPVGLAAALHLRASGLPLALEVFDAAPAPAAEPGAQPPASAKGDPRVLALSEASRQWLAQVGGWPVSGVTAISSIHVSQQAPGLASLPTALLDRADVGLPALGYTVRYGNLLRALQAAARAAAVRVRYGAAVRTAPRADGRIDLTGDAGVLATVDLVLLAEGGAFHNQDVRPWHRDYGQTALVGRLRCERPHHGRAFERFTAHGPIALLPHDGAAGIGGLEHALVWCVAPGSVQELLALNPQEQLRRFQQELPVAAGRGVELAITGHFPLGLNARTRVVQARQVQLGNAAQTLHPVAGQGLNLGLRDAAALVETLRTIAAAPDRLDAALRAYGRARLPDRLALLGMTDLLARGFTWGWPGAAGLRAAALAAVQALPPLRRGLQRRMIYGWRG